MFRDAALARCDPAFAAWAKRMKASRLLERCEKAAIEKGQS